AKLHAGPNTEAAPRLSKPQPRPWYSYEDPSEERQSELVRRSALAHAARRVRGRRDHSIPRSCGRTMSDAVQIAIITSTASSVPTMVIGFLIFLRNRKREKADIERDKLARDTHMLVNSGMGEQLLIAMVSAKNLAYAKPTKENID